MVDPVPRTDLSDLVRTRRAEMGIALRPFAELCIDPETGTTQFTHGWVGKLEKNPGTLDVPKLPQLRALANGLKLPLRVIQEAAAAQFIGLDPGPLWTPGGEARIWLARMDELSPEDRKALAVLAESLIRKNTNPTGDATPQ